VNLRQRIQGSVLRKREQAEGPSVHGPYGIIAPAKRRCCSTVRDPSGLHGDNVFDTDIQFRSREIIEPQGTRWSIDVTNRETKQLLGTVNISVVLAYVGVMALLLRSPLVCSAIRQCEKVGAGPCTIVSCPNNETIIPAEV